jgi:geranylgeranyl pyrophosphate synthase
MTATVSVTESVLLCDLERRLVAVARELPALRAGMRPYLQRGKRLRSKLLLTIGTAGISVASDTLVRYASFVELVHAGGLCHDDVVDRSTTRRGRPSIGALYGIPAASHAGLYLMTRAYECVAGEEVRVRSWVATAATRVARGQAQEMSDLYRDDVSADEYISRASDKTAALFELSARLGAIGGGFGDVEQEVVAEYGATIGLAFQLADDLRDLIGGAALGRERGTDVREGVYTLPLILTLSLGLDGADELRRLMRSVRMRREQQTIDRCCDIVTSNGGMRAAVAVMRGYVERAVMLAHRMPTSLARVLSTLAIKVTSGVSAPSQTPVA